jgi:hypothetical protein
VKRAAAFFARLSVAFALLALWLFWLFAPT